MHFSLRLALMCGAIALAGCDDEPPTKKTLPKIVRTGPGESPAASATSPPSPSAVRPAAAGENDGLPDITPAPLSPEAARTETGARAMLLAWARGIELREFDQAWDLMGQAAKDQASKSAFNARFGQLRDITVAVPTGTMEGAAGSSFYTAPTTVSGIRADGSRAELRGEVILRRTNDVPGATAEQLRWHIVSVHLEPV